MPYHLKHTAYTWLLVLVTLLCGTACTDTFNETSTTDGRTATVCLHIPQLEAATRVTGTNLENAIYTLRVVILSTGAKSINESFSSDELTTGTVTIKDVPVGEVQIYVIANEGSIGKDYTNLSTLQGDVEQSTKKLLIQDTYREYFPKRGSVFEVEHEKGLPMGWMNKTQTIQEGKNTIDVQLERQVAKLNIQMYNTLSTAITVKTISFGAFHSDRFYFFRDQNLDVPDDAEYAPKIFDQIGTDGNGITIDGGKTGTMVCYVYPSFAWKEGTITSPYTIGFTTENATYTPQNFINPNNGALNSIVRNTQVNIYATLSKSANLNLSFSVLPWENYSTDVPSFD